MSDRVLPSSAFTTPMPPVTPPRRRPLEDEVDNAGLAAVLVERGVEFPLGGYAPGLYVGTCTDCRRTHTADKRASQCLPCAVSDVLVPVQPPVELPEIVRRLRAACELVGSQQEWARYHDLSPGYVSDVLSGRRDPGTEILIELGIERIVSYRRAPL